MLDIYQPKPSSLTENDVKICQPRPTSLIGIIDGLGRYTHAKVENLREFVQ